MLNTVFYGWRRIKKENIKKKKMVVWVIRIESRKWRLTSALKNLNDMSFDNYYYVVL